MGLLDDPEPLDLASLEALSREIEAHAPLLIGQGILVLKVIVARHFWYLRFMLPADETSRRHHRCLYDGRESDEELVVCIRTLLEHCRAPQQGLQQLTAFVEIAEMLQGSIQASMHAMVRQIG